MTVFPVTGPGDLCECAHIRYEHSDDGACFAATPTLTCGGGHPVTECPYPNVCHCTQFEVVS